MTGINEDLGNFAGQVNEGKISRREFMKRAAALGLSATAVSSILAACTIQVPESQVKVEPAATTAPKPAAAPAELAGSLTVWGWANPWLRATSEAFQKQHPKVQFEWVDMSWQDTHQKLAVALASGSGAPDVLSIDGAQIQKFVKLGGLLDITEPMTPHVKEFVPYKIREASDENGRMFAVPWDIGTVSLFYRKDIFEENEVTPPKTWDEYITIGQKLAQKGNYMMAFSLTTPNPQDVSFFQKLLWQNGGSYFDRDSGAVTLDNDKGIEAMEMYARIAFAGITVDIAPFTPAWFGAWKDDTLVTEPGAGWMLHVFPDNIKEGEGSYGQWRVADYLPAFQEGGTPTSNLGGSNVAITEQVKNPEAAIAYALFTCASIEGQVIMAEMGTFPSHLPTLQDPQIKDVQIGVYSDQKVYGPFIELTPLVPNTYWRDSAFPEADVIVNAGLNHILAKRWTPEEGIKELANQIRAATLRA
jgi:lactose/L-arabinose transport system substrate-binding protein